MAAPQMFEAIEIATGKSDGYTGTWEQVCGWIEGDLDSFEIQAVAPAAPVDTSSWNFWS